MKFYLLYRINIYMLITMTHTHAHTYTHSYAHADNNYLDSFNITIDLTDDSNSDKTLYIYTLIEKYYDRLNKNIVLKYIKKNIITKEIQIVFRTRSAIISKNGVS